MNISTGTIEVMKTEEKKSVKNGRGNGLKGNLTF
jgi:hypothetical protein